MAIGKTPTTLALLVILLLILLREKSEAFTACTGGNIGVDPPSSVASATDTSGVGYLLEDDTYQVTCCGYISSWEIETSGTGTVILQIWRKVGTNSHKLVGKNTVTVTSSGTTSVTVTSAERISVQHGDMIGWYATTNIIMHATASGNPVSNRFSTSITDLSVGSIYDWTAENFIGSQALFAIKAVASASTVPAFTFGTATTVSITDNTAADDNILTLSVNDDGGDTIVYSTYANDNSYFYVNTDNGQLRTSQTNIPEGTYIVTPMVTDDCYNTATTVVTITVTNVALTFDGFSEASATISEDEYEEKNLTNILITEPNDNYYCYLTSDTSFPFITRQASILDPGYTVYLQDWSQLDYDTRSSYLLTAECVEAISSAPVTVTGTFTVSVTRNTGPTLATASDTATLDANTDWTGTLVYTVGVTDPENDPLTMTMKTNPDDGLFILTNDGKITLTSNIKHHTTVSSYTLTVNVTDSDSHSEQQMSVAVTINNINNAPSLTMPPSITVTENEDLGKSILQVVATDTDAADTIEYYAQFNQSFGSKLFTLNSTTGELFTSSINTIDFDIISDSSLEIYVTASDGYHFDTGTTIITIINENESPVLSQKYFKVARDEGMTGESFPTIDYNVIDPDVTYAGDTYSFSKNCGADDSRVAITSGTGQFTFNMNYDLDVASNPTDFSCIVTVTDAAGLTDTCIVDIHVDYVNEFTPTFNDTSYSVTVLYSEFVGSIVLTVTATDDDLSDHGTFFYEILNTENLFGVLQNGSIFVQGDLSAYYPNGHTVNMNLKAQDTGGLSSTVPVTVNIPSEPFETTTDTPWEYFDNRYNMITLEIAGVIGFACVTVSIYFAVKYIRMWLNAPPSPVKIVRQEQPKMQVSHLFNSKSQRPTDAGISQSPPPAYTSPSP